MSRIITLLLLVFSTNSLGAPRPFMSIKPVKISQTDGGSLSYWKPCGYQELGIVVRQFKEKTKVGVLIRSKGIQCLGPATRTLVPLNGLFNKRLLNNLVSYNPRHESFRLRTLTVENTYLYKDRLYSNYRTRCINGFANILKIENRTLKVGVLAGTRKDACPTTSKRIAIQGIGGEGFDKVEKMEQAKNRNFKVKMARIKGSSIKAEQDGSKSFSYLRRCNDAPLGIVQKNGQFAMLVARYSNVECPRGGHRKSWSRYKTRKFTQYLNNKSLLSKKQRRGSFELISPLNIAMNSKGLKLKSAASCGKFAGVVLLEDSPNGKISTLRQRTDRPCKKVPSKVSLTLNGFPKSGGKPESLRLIY